MDITEGVRILLAEECPHYHTAMKGECGRCLTSVLIRIRIGGKTPAQQKKFESLLGG